MSEYRITDPDWLDKLQPIREEATTVETLIMFGVPPLHCRGLELEDIDLTEDCFEKRIYTSPNTNDASERLTIDLYSALIQRRPNVQIKALSFQSLLEHLREKIKKKQLASIDCLFIYHFGAYGIRDWEQNMLLEFLLDRINNEKHFSFCCPLFPRETVIKNLGKSVFKIVSTYCKCIEV